MARQAQGLIGRLARAAAGTAVAAAACLGPAGCAKINVDATGYRKYWQPFVSPSPADGDSRADDAPGDLESFGELTCRIELGK